MGSDGRSSTHFRHSRRFVHADCFDPGRQRHAESRSHCFGNLAQQQYQTVVTAGSTSLRATIGGTSDPAADLDLFVFNCTSGTCVLAGQSADGDSEESVTIPNPAAGNWLVLIDGYAVPAGTTTYNYVDVFTNAV